jgi:urease accessory protein
MTDARIDTLVEAARAQAHDRAQVVAGVTALHQRVVLLRALAHRVEPAMALAQAVRAAWRGVAWQLAPTAPRVWRT